MADKDVSQAAEPPKPVHIGGESFVDRILPHMKQIIAVAIAAVAVAAIIIGARWFGERKAVTSTEKLDQVLVVASEPVRPKAEGSAAGSADPNDPQPPSFATAKERSAAVLDAIAKQGTDAAGAAYRGGLLMDTGKFDEAVTEYRRCATDNTPARALDSLLCREGLGLALEAKAAADKDAAARQKGLEEALAAFVAMQPDESGPRRAFALYHQARVQQQLGKRAEAKALFDKAKLANKSADREIAELIEKRLAALGAS